MVITSLSIMFHKIDAKSISDHWSPYDMGVLSDNYIKDRDGCIYHRDCVSCNIMIRGCIKNHRTRDAREIFDRMYHRNTVSWNSMIMAYTHEERCILH
uniref:Uncharacterized protein n=1 Tax=Nelumbo nucifera TaxID=4432 RepID=A0A822Y9T5_NELNU|nr:TPA_asm: hypothetical protein HUJ06_029486 [Nelumbo nucifera]